MKTFLNWCKSVVVGATAGVFLALMAPQPATAWDSQPNDQEFKGDVLLTRAVYLGNLNATNKLTASAAELSAVAPSNGQVRLTFTGATLAVPTNGATLTATNVVWSLTASGGGVTNTLTLGAPSAPTNVAQFLVLQVAVGQTNWVKVTDGSTAVLASTWVGAAGGTLTLVSLPNGTNWYELARSAN